MDRFSSRLLKTQSTLGQIGRNPLETAVMSTAAKKTGVPTTTINKLNNWFTGNYRYFFSKPSSNLKLLGYAIIFVVIVTIIIFVVPQVRKQVIGFENPNTNNNEVAKDASRRVDQLIVNGTENHATNDDYKLINLQPVCFKQAAYLGKDTFDSDLGILEQFRLGSRFFFLQIDYIETDSLDKYKFGNPYEPVLIWRDNSNKLSSVNSASLNNTFKSILNYYNNSSAPFSNYPLVIMLHFVRIPYKKDEINNYKEYVDKVSEALKIFKGVTVTGFTQAKNELDLFNNKFSDFNGKIIIGTNIDTTIYSNNSLKLDKKIHFRYYVKESEIIDETAVDASSDKVNAYIYDAQKLLDKKTTLEQDRWVDINRKKFTIVKPSNNKNLTKEEIDILLNKFKVNLILHDYFSDELENSKGIFRLYNNSCYKIKTTY